MLKHTKHIIFFILALFAIVSCADYLDTDKYFKDRMSVEKAFKQREYAENWLAHAYSFLQNENADVCNKNHSWHNFADDIYTGDWDELYKKFKNGEYDEGSLQASWSSCYKGIRQASEFINNIDINEEMTQEEITDYKGQARFVRAYFYWLLLRKYGPIPIIKNDDGMIDYTLPYSEIALPRNHYDDCVEYITSELVQAAKELLLDREALNIARPTRGAALSARAKVLLFAASPLANGNNDDYAALLVDDEGNRLLPEKYDEMKWAKAAAAAKDVMELGKYQLYVSHYRDFGNNDFPQTIAPPYHPDYSGRDWPNGWKNIDPFASYRALFNGELSASTNPELIFSRVQNGTGGESGGLQWMVVHMLPRAANGWNTIGVTQKQCDAYYMDDGSDVSGKDKEIGRGNGSDRSDGYVTAEDMQAGRYKPLLEGTSLQYANREPRFYASVAYNGALWPLSAATQADHRNYRAWYYRGSPDGYSNNFYWLRTGIGCKKYVHPYDTYENNSLSQVRYKTEPAIRYAEILLIYAEALNELNESHQVPSWDGSKTHTISRDISEIKKGILPIRLRAGLPDYPSDVYANKDAFRKKLKRERQVELMAEGHRYYDLRRWKDAPVEEVLPVFGCNTLMTENQRDLFHTPVAVSSLPTTFSDKMWFWPISKSELKRNSRLTQNPGWQTYD